MDVKVARVLKYCSHYFHALTLDQVFGLRLKMLLLAKILLKTLALVCIALFVLINASSLTNNTKSNVATVGSPLKRWYSGDAHRVTGNRTLPVVIIFGVRKCGTRALLDFMSTHPQVAAAPYEVHFFDRNYEKGYEWYRQQMPMSVRGDLTIEKTPGYFITPDTPRRVYEMNKDIKLILIVRDPVTRAVSDYTQVWSKRDEKNETMEPFEQLVLDPYTNSVNLNFKPLWVSVYHHHMHNWLEYFPLKQFHIVDGERLVTNPAAELHKVEQFLHIDAYLTEEKFYLNSTKGFYCMRTNSMDRCLGDSKGRKHPNVSHRVLKKLKLFYKQHNRLFFKLIGRTFNW